MASTYHLAFRWLKASLKPVWSIEILKRERERERERARVRERERESQRLTDCGVGMVTMLPRLLVVHSSVSVSMLLLSDEASVLPGLAAGLEGGGEWIKT